MEHITSFGAGGTGSRGNTSGDLSYIGAGSGSSADAGGTGICQHLASFDAPHARYPDGIVVASWTPNSPEPKPDHVV